MSLMVWLAESVFCKPSTNSSQIAIGLCPFEEQEHLILDLQVGKGQLRRAILVLRRWHQLVDVLFEVNLG